MQARGDDAVGLWLFPADGSGRGTGRVVPVGPLDDTQRGAIVAELGRATPAGDTPLFDTAAEGVLELGPSDDATVTKLIVTNGEDTTSTRGPDDLLAVARTGRVRVFVITIGGTSFAARPLESLTADTGGACYAETPPVSDGGSPRSSTTRTRRYASVDQPARAALRRRGRRGPVHEPVPGRLAPDGVASYARRTVDR